MFISDADPEYGKLLFSRLVPESEENANTAGWKRTPQTIEDTVGHLSRSGKRPGAHYTTGIPHGLD